MNCRFCNAKNVYLSPEVGFCHGCGVGYSSRAFNTKVYDKAYSERFANQGVSDIGRRINTWRLGVVSSYLPTGSHLMDFGCGAGDFIKTAASLYRVCGVEANDDSASLARQRGHTVRTFSDLSSFSVDCITFFDSLEHVPDVEARFPVIVQGLSDNGWVIISMPQVKERVSSEWFSSWRHNRPDEHLVYFTVDGLKYFLGRHGFDVLYVTNQESLLRVDPNNYEKNIMTMVARKL